MTPNPTTASNIFVSELNLNLQKTKLGCSLWRNAIEKKLWLKIKNLPIEKSAFLKNNFTFLWVHVSLSLSLSLSLQSSAAELDDSRMAVNTLPVPMLA